MSKASFFAELKRRNVYKVASAVARRISGLCTVSFIGSRLTQFIQLGLHLINLSPLTGEDLSA